MRLWVLHAIPFRFTAHDVPHALNALYVLLSMQCSYMTRDGRISLSGVTTGNVARLAKVRSGEAEKGLAEVGMEESCPGTCPSQHYLARRPRNIAQSARRARHCGAPHRCASRH